MTGAGVATYKITPPCGSRDSADDATYTTKLVGNQVSDSVGNFVASKTLLIGVLGI